MNTTNIVILAAGFIAGAVICRFYQEHLVYSYYTAIPGEDPSPPHPPGYKEKCNKVTLYNGKVIEVCDIISPGNTTTGSSNQVPFVLPRGKNVDPRADPLHPNRTKDDKGYPILRRYQTTEYPDYYPGDGPPVRDQPDYGGKDASTQQDIAATYARAYQGHEVNPISQDDIDFYKTKQIVESIARQRGIPVTIVRLRIAKIIANYNKTHPNGHPIPFTYAVPVPQPYFSAGQHYDTIPNYEGQGNVTLAPERKYIARQPNNVFDIWA